MCWGLKGQLMLVELEKEGISDELVTGQTGTGMDDKDVVSASWVGIVVYEWVSDRGEMCWDEPELGVVG